MISYPPSLLHVFCATQGRKRIPSTPPSIQNQNRKALLNGQQIAIPHRVTPVLFFGDVVLSPDYNKLHLRSANTPASKPKAVIAPYTHHF